MMSAHRSPSPGVSPAAQHAPDPNDEQHVDSAHDTGHKREGGEREGETAHKPHRYGRKELEDRLPPDPDPDDPVSP